MQFNGIEYFVIRFGKLCALLLLCTSGFSTPVSLQASQQDVHVGVLAFRGVDKAVERWQPSIDYLKSQLPAYRFFLVPLNLDEMTKAVANKELDFVLTNTGHYVNLEAKYGITRIATLRNLRQGVVLDAFGAVIISRKDRTDIKKITDLRDKSFAAVSKKAFGGFQMAWYELTSAGLDPFDDMQLDFVGFPQDKIVQRVLDGSVDAGTVRTDVLEKMAKQGRIKLDDLRVMNRQTTAGFPFQHSTRLYPEWPFARADHTSGILAKQVAVALLQMPMKHSASISGSHAGWTVPLDYQPVHELFKELHVGPYKHYGEITLYQALKKYWYWLLILPALLGLGFLLLRGAELKKFNNELKVEVEERRRAEKELHTHAEKLEAINKKLKHSNRELDDFAYIASHDLKEPLRGINNYSTFLMEDYGDKLDKEGHRMLETLQRLTHRLEERIESLLSFSRAGKCEMKMADTDLNEVVKECLELLEARIQETGVEIRQSEALPNVVGDRARIGDIYLNLISNACKYNDKSQPWVEVGSLSSSTNPGPDGEVFSEPVMFVKDNGIGIRKKHLDTVFRFFKRLHGNDKYGGGTGAGLTIAKKLVERHGGKLWIESEPDLGTTFFFTLKGELQ